MAVRYKATLASSGLPLGELRVLAEASAELPEAPDLRTAVVGENILAKPTASARQRIWEKLNDRYGLDGLNPIGGHWLRQLKNQSHEGLGQLAVLRWASGDLLLRALWFDLYLPRSLSEAAYGSADLLQWIEAGELRLQARRYFADRSTSVQESIAQHLLVVLRSLGAATGRAKKVFRPCVPAMPGVAFAKALADADGVRGTAMLDYWALRWWGDTQSRADELLARLQREGPDECQSGAADEHEIN